MKKKLNNFDIAPFALPNGNPGELRFEDPRNIARVRVTFTNEPPSEMGVSYLRRYWPEYRREDYTWSPMEKPFGWSWFNLDDQFTGKWQQAAVNVSDENGVKVITFKPLSEEFPAPEDYDVEYRHTLGFKLDVKEPASIQKIEVFTTSSSEKTTLHVETGIGKTVPSARIEISGNNAVIDEIIPVSASRKVGNSIIFIGDEKGVFDLSITHMHAPEIVDGDEGQITFEMGEDTFTISLESLKKEGPIWNQEQGFFITDANDDTTFSEYQESHRKKQNITQMVLNSPEQSFANAHFRQPRPHIENSGYIMGYKYARQTFRISANGDILMDFFNIRDKGPALDTPRFKNSSILELAHGYDWRQPAARFLFGLERWYKIGCFCDPAPMMSFNVHVRKDGLVLEEKTIAVPLMGNILNNNMASDDAMVVLVHFKFKNTNLVNTRAELPIKYSQFSSRAESSLGYKGLKRKDKLDDYLVPYCQLDDLKLNGNQISSEWKGENVLRCVYQSDVAAQKTGENVLFSKDLAPAEEWEFILKIPFISLETDEEVEALNQLDFNHCYHELAEYWHDVAAQGTQIHTPIPQINELFKNSLPHLQVSDFLRADGSGLIHVPTGTSTYRDYPKETVLMTHSLDERGLHEEARKRYGIWLKYQGTKALPGNFTDHDGVFFGSNGFEGMGYNQHHGWILWGLAEHLFLTGDKHWYSSITPKLLAGVDWVVRQRKNTMRTLPNSRGWEYGFLPAGALEDIEDYNYWISTNVLTWRGLNHTAKALSEIGHPQAGYVQQEADTFKTDLVRGLETMRKHSPLVALRDGRWVPNYPSRIYRRGRDVGWTREVYEGSMFMLISGLYDYNSQQAEWIINDYQDNRYTRPPYGYHTQDFETNWFSRAGFCPEANFFPDELPYIDRDQAEIYMWMFFNAWNIVWEEELCCMAEHPAPFLGFHNLAQYKTSEEIPALTKMQYMFVYANESLLHFGRAIPREWLEDGNNIHATGVTTCYGESSVSYLSDAAEGKITASIHLALRKTPQSILVRFRHPEKSPIKTVLVNGKEYDRFDPKKGDVDISDFVGDIEVVTTY
jgi:hypothetical protein